MKKRIAYIDLLRIIAIFAVIMIHVSAENWYTDTIDSNWLFNNFINTLVNGWPVPLFVVISGSLQLNNDKFTIKNMFFKYIPRILLCLIFWHVIYYFYSKPIFNLDNLITCFKSLLLGKTYSHLWFLYMLLGLYLLTPILNKLVKNLTKKEFIYILVLGFGLTSFIPTINLLFDIDLTKFILPYKVLNFNVYIFYYLLGYYLFQYSIPKSSLLLFISIVSFIVLGIVSGYRSYYLKDAFTYASNSSVFSLMIVTSLYSIVKEKYGKMVNHRFSLVGKLTFGVYLIHFFIEKLLVYAGIHAYIMTPILGNVVISFLVFGLSFLLCYVISKISFLRRFIM